MKPWLLERGQWQVEKIERMSGGQFSGSFSYVVWRKTAEGRQVFRGPFDSAAEAQAVCCD